MTLIEILVVVAILGMLATAVTVTVLDQFEDAKGERARMDIAAITQGLSAYYIKMGKYPTTGEGSKQPREPAEGQPVAQRDPERSVGERLQLRLPRGARSRRALTCGAGSRRSVR